MERSVRRRSMDLNLALLNSTMSRLRTFMKASDSETLLVQSITNLSLGTFSVREFEGIILLLPCRSRIIKYYDDRGWGSCWNHWLWVCCILSDVLARHGATCLCWLLSSRSRQAGMGIFAGQCTRARRTIASNRQISGMRKGTWKINQRRTHLICMTTVIPFHSDWFLSLAYIE